MDLSAVRAKIAAGILPRAECHQTRIRTRPATICRVCDGPTTSVDMVAECHWAGLVLIAHPDCFVMWEEARRLGS